MSEIYNLPGLEELEWVGLPATCGGASSGGSWLSSMTAKKKPLKKTANTYVCSREIARDTDNCLSHGLLIN